MAQRNRFDSGAYRWADMTDPELERRLREERRRSQLALSKIDRATAHSNVQAILWEKTRRYEASWGL